MKYLPILKLIAFLLITSCENNTEVTSEKISNKEKSFNELFGKLDFANTEHREILFNANRPISRITDVTFRTRFQEQDPLNIRLEDEYIYISINVICDGLYLNDIFTLTLDHIGENKKIDFKSIDQSMGNANSGQISFKFKFRNLKDCDFNLYISDNMKNKDMLLNFIEIRYVKNSIETQFEDYLNGGYHQCGAIIPIKF